MKRIAGAVGALLCVILIICSVSAGAGAMSMSSGLTALRGQWSRGYGPKTDGLSISYSYFAPKTDRKCPLAVLMPGAGEGTPEGHELDANDFAYWSSDELQSRANAGGMYIMIMRAPEPVYFDTCPTEPIFAAVRDFAENHNVDMGRIFVGGWCVGATGAVNLAEAHPGFFDGVMLFSPRTFVSDIEAKALKNMKFWLFSSKGDTYSNYATFVLTSWNNITAATADKSQVRLTSSSLAPRAALILNHYSWLVAEQDFSPAATSQYKGLTTVDGNGKTIASPSVISFMTSSEGYVEETETETETETESETEEESESETQTETETETATEYSEKDYTELKRGEDEKQSNPAKTALIVAAVAASLITAGVIIAVIKKKK